MVGSALVIPLPDTFLGWFVLEGPFWWPSPQSEHWRLDVAGSGGCRQRTAAAAAGLPRQQFELLQRQALRNEQAVQAFEEMARAMLEQRRTEWEQLRPDPPPRIPRIPRIRASEEGKEGGPWGFAMEGGLFLFGRDILPPIVLSNGGCCGDVC